MKRGIFMREIVVTDNPDHLKGEISFAERLRQLAEYEAKNANQTKRLKQSPYNKFAQLNLEGSINMNAMCQLADSPAATKLFWFIVNNMDGYNALIASYKVFEESLNMSNSTVTRGIRHLKELGLLHIKKSGSANVYLVNPKVIWKSWGSNVKYCEFPAKVILSASEQIDFRDTIHNQTHSMITTKENKDRC